MSEDYDLVYTWKAWECPQCGGQNDYDHTKISGSTVHECIHCDEKVFIEDN